MHDCNCIILRDWQSEESAWKKRPILLKRAEIGILFHLSEIIDEVLLDYFSAIAIVPYEMHE